MPKKGYKQTEEHKRKLAKKIKGKNIIEEIIKVIDEKDLKQLEVI